MGGGFGGKETQGNAYAAICALAALVTGKPVGKDASSKKSLKSHAPTKAAHDDNDDNDDDNNNNNDNHNDDKRGARDRSEKKAKRTADATKSDRKRKHDDEVADDAAVPPRSKSSKKSSSATASTAATATTPASAGQFDVSQFRLSAVTVQALKERGISSLFEIQAKTFDAILDGKDVVGRARTGSGKTLAFALPIIERLMQIDGEQGARKYGAAPRALIMCPTRELAKQIVNEIELCARKVTTVAMYGGTPYGQQESALRRGVDVVIGTPGRISDMIAKGTLRLSDVLFVVLDEADEMLNMGFQKDVEEILEKLPAERQHQTLMFSATMPPWVESVARKHLRPTRVTIDVAGSAAVPKRVNHYGICCP